ncbi:UDP-N-acetylmuramoyl-tripeptide--D-alanyl-D-alanine ligase [Brevundimonas sp. 2R-24]|uniref:UDP-N-acetylmuramoyl-tripeptide--D-alanyl-D-alanine ligase n=1 Tax=Peiella sedimenti TaxID=3061083 RepID=A0ABT8SQP4_9CAUL|nr:UDP-N-acetylmuramoyl-tripeptide--D-alanyl-D-alanine ligase [Caulobacteraceae bacterium XZ-24]
MSDPLWTTAEVAEAAGGTLAGPSRDITGVTFDSREVQPGDLFIALQGVRDGHDFVPQAFEKGAAAALVSRPVGGPAIVVGDTTQALNELGRFARERAPQTRRCAVTGSVGKTSVTQAIRAGVDAAGKAHGSVKSYNNHIGVPLTLARMPRDTERAVFEIGMNAPGEIAPLSRLVQPHVAVITTVGPVHIEAFADGEAGIAREKASIVEGLPPGGLAVLNADNPWFETLKEMALHRGARVAAFGSQPFCDGQLLDYRATERGSRVTGRVLDQEYAFDLAQRGAHWGLNSLAVLLALAELDVPMQTAIEALAGYAPLAGRGQTSRIAIEGGGFTLIDESYNANPMSMRAAFASLAALDAGAGRRIVALTDMLELGEHGPGMHAGLAEDLDRLGVDLVFTAGPLMRHLHEALPESRRGGWAETAAELAPLATAAVRAGDLVMVKGSNGSKASLIAAALKGLHGDG